MNHCSGGPATDSFDSIQAMVDWVEKGIAPDTIAARALPSSADFPQRTRPAVPVSEDCQVQVRGRSRRHGQCGGCGQLCLRPALSLRICGLDGAGPEQAFSDNEKRSLQRALPATAFPPPPMPAPSQRYTTAQLDAMRQRHGFSVRFLSTVSENDCIFEGQVQEHQLPRACSWSAPTSASTMAMNPRPSIRGASPPWSCWTARPSCSCPAPARP